MSHEFESGFVVRKQAWHGLATVLEDNPSIDDALRRAGLDWQVRAEPVFAHVDDVSAMAVDAGGQLVIPTKQIEIPTHRAVIRETDGAVLGIVSKDYKVFQNREALDVFAELVRDGTLRIETAGSLQGGRKVWIQCRYADDVEVKDGDRIAPYVLLAMGHDGKLSIVFMNTPTRVVCWNTMQAAGAVEDSVAFDKPGTFRVSHMGDVRKKVQDARDAVVRMNRELGLSVEAYRRMAKQPISEQKVRDLARSIFDDSLVKARSLLERLRNEQAQRAEHMDVQQRADVAAKIAEVEKMLADWKPSRAETEVVRSFHEGPGHELAGETVWGAVNAVTDYIDHGKGGGQDRRMTSSWFGNGAGQRRKAFAAAAEMI